MSLPAFARRALAPLLLAAPLLGCASIDNAPVNRPSTLPKLTQANTLAGDDTLRSTIVALAFSGGGTRASAFSFGVLKGLSETPAPNGGALIDQVRFVSGVSGGSVTAAYFGLKGRAALSDFESRFLYRDAEESLRTQVYSVGNLMRAADGGVNDRSGLPTWLEKNLFGKATLKDLSRPGRPVVWINASDIYSKTPFVFEPVTFAAICSDWESYPLSEAVAASAAVPIVFAPVVIQNYAKKCGFKLPDELEAQAHARDTSPIVKSYLKALQDYRDADKIKFVKLLDGGLTDNWGLSAFNVQMAAAREPWRPMTKADAISVSDFQFIVVDAGRNVAGDWTKTLEGPNAQELLDAVADTAVDSAVRSSYEVMRLQMKLWEQRLKQWRCSLSPEEVSQVRGSTDGWVCDAVSIRLDRVSFEDLGTSRAAELGRVPTRFKLSPDQVKMTVDAGEAVIRRVFGPKPEGRDDR
ncbi:MAG: patatin-like phospholipase family protein [Hyphomicrobiales bacterium]|nr:patatin-like phospholipase family protein [Hyphomicrobiales bacterium]